MANEWYRTKLIHFLIGSRGMMFEDMKTSLARLGKPKRTDILNLVILLIKAVVEAYYRCWVARNKIKRTIIEKLYVFCAC